MDLLRRRDVPIMHFVDLPLYEDDLGDNGDSVMRLRLRVMPSCFLLLLRHALRVDGLLIRHHETRIFHKFGLPHVLRARTHPASWRSAPCSSTQGRIWPRLFTILFARLMSFLRKSTSGLRTLRRCVGVSACEVFVHVGLRT